MAEIAKSGTSISCVEFEIVVSGALSGDVDRGSLLNSIRGVGARGGDRIGLSGGNLNSVVKGEGDRIKGESANSPTRPVRLFRAFSFSTSPSSSLVGATGGLGLGGGDSTRGAEKTVPKSPKILVRRLAFFSEPASSSWISLMYRASSGCAQASHHTVLRRKKTDLFQSQATDTDLELKRQWVLG